METSPLIRGANQWTGFCMITASVMKELIQIDETDYRRIGCSSYHLTC